ncbi:MAG TPA: hypothetical protein VM260_21675, partial [Pirellula sp.]|nr:hypothetical protein [Pirellula sp.]
MTTVSYVRNGKTYSADVESMKPETIAYLLQYGWAQSLQDSIAGLAKKVAEENGDVDQAIDGQLMKRSDAILSGSIAVRSVGESRDPLRSIANGMVRKALALKGAKVDKEKFAALVQQLLETKRE